MLLYNLSRTLKGSRLLYKFEFYVLSVLLELYFVIPTRRMKMCEPVLECTKARKQARREQGKVVNRGPGPSDDLCAKYELYFDFKCMAWHTKPHSVSKPPTWLQAFMQIIFILQTALEKNE